MKLRYPHAARWLLCACTAVMLVACGGGGGGEGEPEQPRDDSGDTIIPTPPPPPPPAPAADLRNGSYTMVASDGYEYTLTLNFDAKSYKVVGNGIDEDGAIEADGSEFEFKPGNAEGSSGFNTMRFSYVDNTVVGEYALPGGTVPFVAARSFATSLPSTPLRFNLLGRWFNPANGDSSTYLRQGEITTNGFIRICLDEVLHELESCQSIFESSLSISGTQFSFPVDDSLNVSFRLAYVGADPFYLGASPSTGTFREFTIGMPVLTSFQLDSFAGGTTGPAWARLTIQKSTYSISFMTPDGQIQTDVGSIIGGFNTLGNLAVATSPELGQFVGVRSTSLTAFITAPESSVSAPGGLFIGTVR